MRASLVDNVSVLFYQFLMQGFLFSERQDDLEAVKSRLDTAFGHIRDDRRLDPTSQFVHAFIGSRTYDEISSRAFIRLVTRYQSWDDLAEADTGEIESILAGVTYAEDKSVNLVHALRKIRACAGTIDLEFLADLPVEIGLLWLESIYGVGRKIAAATLNFSTLRKRAFVVDTHVLRVVRRYGFVTVQADSVAVYDAIMASASEFDADDLYELHWQLKYLGQRICTHANARCNSCFLADICLRRVEKRLEPANTAMQKITAHRASSAEIPESVRVAASLTSNVKA
jgi:endonuclease III